MLKLIAMLLWWIGFPIGILIQLLGIIYKWLAIKQLQLTGYNVILVEGGYYAWKDGEIDQETLDILRGESGSDDE